MMIGGPNMNKFVSDLYLSFFIALGVVVGGAVIGSLATLLVPAPPLRTMQLLADRLKLWGAVAALGGTFYTIRTIETGISGGQLTVAVKQILYVVSAFSGAQLGYYLISVLSGGR